MVAGPGTVYALAVSADADLVSASGSDECVHVFTPQGTRLLCLVRTEISDFYV